MTTSRQHLNERIERQQDRMRQILALIDLMNDDKEALHEASVRTDWEGYLFFMDEALIKDKKPAKLRVFSAHSDVLLIDVAAAVLLKVKRAGKLQELEARVDFLGNLFS